MSLRRYTFVIELAEAGSFRRAAENLNITHTALVHSIKALEEEYGVRLFDRGRGVKATPTKFGEIFIRHARQLLKGDHDLLFDLRCALDPGAGILNLALGPFPQNISGQAAVSRMIARFPDLQIKVSIRQFKQAVSLILDLKADLALAEQAFENPHPELEVETLPNHLGGFFCRVDHPLLVRKDLNMDDIVGFPWCCTRMPSRIRSFLPPSLGRAGHFDPVTNELVPNIEIESLFGLKTLIQGSDILCPMALVTFREELVNGELALLPFHDSWMATNYRIFSLKNRKVPPAAAAYLEEVRRLEKNQIIEGRKLVKSHFKVAEGWTLPA